MELGAFSFVYIKIYIMLLLIFLNYGPVLKVSIIWTRRLQGIGAGVPGDFWTYRVAIVFPNPTVDMLLSSLSFLFFTL